MIMGEIMNREELIDKINEIFDICQAENCGITCPHSDELEEYGKLLEKDILWQRELRKDVMFEFEKEEERQIDIEVVKQLIKEGKTNAYIANLFGVDPQRLSYVLNKEKIYNTNSLQKQPYRYSPEIVKDYIAKGYTNAEIRKEYGIPSATLRALLKREGIENPNSGKVVNK